MTMDVKYRNIVAALGELDSEEKILRALETKHTGVLRGAGDLATETDLDAHTLEHKRLWRDVLRTRQAKKAAKRSVLAAVSEAFPHVVIGEK